MPGPARAVLICALLLLGLTVTNAGLAQTVTPDFQRAEVLAGMAAVGLMLVAVLFLEIIGVGMLGFAVVAIRGRRQHALGSGAMSDREGPKEALTDDARR